MVFHVIVNYSVSTVQTELVITSAQSKRYKDTTSWNSLDPSVQLKVFRANITSADPEKLWSINRAVAQVGHVHFALQISLFLDMSVHHHHCHHHQRAFNSVFYGMFIQWSIQQSDFKQWECFFFWMLCMSVLCSIFVWWWISAVISILGPIFGVHFGLPEMVSNAYPHHIPGPLASLMDTCVCGPSSTPLPHGDSSDSENTCSAVSMCLSLIHI